MGGQAQGDRLAIKMLVAAGYVTEAKANEALNIAHGFDKGPLAPPSAPVGVEDVVMAARNAENAIRNCAAAGQIGEGYVQYADDLRDAVQRLAQQPAPVAPVGVDTLAALRIAHKHLDMRSMRVSHCKDAAAIESALAQQPAAVDGAK